MSRLVAPLYAQAAAGVPQSVTEAWIAALGFTLQIYFDFSGYTDMALGLARFFGIKLPVNFNSPLKASSIVDFWLRWHVSLTRFLTAYIYNPLTLTLTRRRVAKGKTVFGGRNTNVSAFLSLLAMPTILTMLISGIWHGAGYTFILWGLMHGVLLCINHAWRLIRPRIWPDTKSYNRRMAPAGFLLTFLSVVFAMVLFRAPSTGAALMLWKGMIGSYGVSLPQAVFARLGSLGPLLSSLGVHPAWTSGGVLLAATMRIGILLVIALALPNTLEILAPYRARPRREASQDPVAAATLAGLATDLSLGLRACLRRLGRHPVARGTERIPVLAILMANPRRFILIWLMSLLGLAGVVVTVNLLVDPYEVFGTPRIAGITGFKPSAKNHAMLAKTYQVARAHPATVVIGSSPIYLGIDAFDPAWPEAMRPVYNYGIPGGYATSTSLRTLQEAIATGGIKNALVFLDFQNFFVAEPPSSGMTEDDRRFHLMPDGSSNPYRRGQVAADMFLSVATMGALIDSITTVAMQRTPGVLNLAPDGSSTEADFVNAARADGMHDLFAQKDAFEADRAVRLAQSMAGWQGPLPNLDIVAEHDCAGPGARREANLGDRAAPRRCHGTLLAQWPLAASGATQDGTRGFGRRQRR